jgi:CheY-like chemotaxis protein
MLLVEDDPDTRKLLRRILTLCGWDVIEAGSIAEALARLDPPPDCLLLDLELPDGDGASILKKIRDDDLPTRVVVNTGIVDAVRLGKVADLHPDCLLRKPLDSEGLKTIAAMEEDAR